MDSILRGVMGYRPDTLADLRVEILSADGRHSGLQRHGSVQKYAEGYNDCHAQHISGRRCARLPPGNGESG